MRPTGGPALPRLSVMVLLIMPHRLHQCARKRLLASLTLSLSLTACADPDAPLGPKYVSVVLDKTEADAVLDPVAPSASSQTPVDPSGAPSAHPDTEAMAVEPVAHVVVVSIDGLATRYLEQLLESGAAPTFERLQTMAAWTHNARTDKTYTNTLPNHTCMLTGLPVSPIQGYRRALAHGYINNGEPGPTDTLHNMGNPARSYTPSIFDVAHDHGFSTALFASKSKFVIYEQSYNGWGAPDTTGLDDGSKKIDSYVHNGDPVVLVDNFVSVFSTAAPRLSFVHLNQPDFTGHSYGWGSDEYLASVMLMDQQLGKILDTVQMSRFAERTALIVTTDHGGVDNSHLDAEDPRNFIIPFYVLAPGTKPGNAYAVFANRYSPGDINPGYDAAEQPLRNGDSGNLALSLLGLPHVSGSVIHGAGLLRD